MSKKVVEFRLLNSRLDKFFYPEDRIGIDRLGKILDNIEKIYKLNCISRLIIHPLSETIVPSSVIHACDQVVFRGYRGDVFLKGKELTES